MCEYVHTRIMVIAPRFRQSHGALVSIMGSFDKSQRLEVWGRGCCVRLCVAPIAGSGTADFLAPSTGVHQIERPINDVRVSEQRRPLPGIQAGVSGSRHIKATSPSYCRQKTPKGTEYCWKILRMKTAAQSSVEGIPDSPSVKHWIVYDMIDAVQQPTEIRKNDICGVLLISQ